MGKGRGSAAVIPVAAAAAVLMAVVFFSGAAEAATYKVGDDGGWTFNVNAWPSGKAFRAGDTLVFNYDPSMHNVVAVNNVGYNRCSTPYRSPVYQSGGDRVTLRKGANYFICNFPGHCQSGMKIAINA
ncbi:hypothetical protein M569_14927, partial [Genlisea aurea]